MFYACPFSCVHVCVLMCTYDIMYNYVLCLIEIDTCIGNYSQVFCLCRLTKLEEQSFSFTNAFTTAGEGSVIKLRDTYRNLQANTRPAANRAHKKKYKGIEFPVAEHTMVLIVCICTV